MRVDLSSYSRTHFDRGASKWLEAVWLVVSLLLFRLCPLSLSALKCSVLRFFGARVGKGVTIKPQVKITLPWRLTVGDNVWLGEECWLLNFARIDLGDNVCISQRAFLCTGSHDYRLPSFDLIVKPITVEEGAWIGASSWVGPGVEVGTNAVLSAGSVCTRNLTAHGIYAGNPAVLLMERVIWPDSKQDKKPLA